MALHWILKSRRVIENVLDHVEVQCMPGVDIGNELAALTQFLCRDNPRYLSEDTSRVLSACTDHVSTKACAALWLVQKYVDEALEVNRYAEREGDYVCPVRYERTVLASKALDTLETNAHWFGYGTPTGRLLSTMGLLEDRVAYPIAEGDYLERNRGLQIDLVDKLERMLATGYRIDDFCISDDEAEALLVLADHLEAERTKDAQRWPFLWEGKDVAGCSKVLREFVQDFWYAGDGVNKLQWLRRHASHCAQDLERGWTRRLSLTSTRDIDDLQASIVDAVARLTGKVGEDGQVLIGAVDELLGHIDLLEEPGISDEWRHTAPGWTRHTDTSIALTSALVTMVLAAEFGPSPKLRLKPFQTQALMDAADDLEAARTRTAKRWGPQAGWSRADILNAKLLVMTAAMRLQPVPWYGPDGASQVTS
jgi:hypothetical protein